MSSNPEKGNNVLKNLEEVIMKEVELVECLQRAVLCRQEFDWAGAKDAYAEAALHGYTLALNAVVSESAWERFEKEINNVQK